MPRLHQTRPNFYCSPAGQTWTPYPAWTPQTPVGPFPSPFTTPRSQYHTYIPAYYLPTPVPRPAPSKQSPYVTPIPGLHPCLPDATESFVVSPVWPPEQCEPVPEPFISYIPVPAFHQPQPKSIPMPFEPGTFPPQPEGSHVPVRLQKNLVFNPLNMDDPTLYWDIVHPPSHARVIAGRRIFLPVPFGEKAAVTVDGAATRILITTDTPYLKYWMEERWGPLIVSRSGGITVRDVLEELHLYFQEPLTAAEVDDIERDDATNAGNLQNALNIRVKDSYEALHVIAAHEGFKRSDALGCLRRFQGLRAVVFQDGTWKLYLGLLPGPVSDFNV
ncbi:hypothetical protein FA15DRAFT_663343 [Coprinopsis marcescibilis]|uniref:DUF6699 domain-containing protein n=1 Tax=Coprinopsis marcescibilis TaxID=230819 RepID=A0A5C3LBQ1_COPMA|nr:hypothetical protein FA15DRAFT_663343 [Coprinopsis marcescibilis]